MESLFNKSLQFYLKETPTQIFKNTYFEEHLRTSALETSSQYISSQSPLPAPPENITGEEVSITQFFKKNQVQLFYHHYSIALEQTHNLLLWSNATQFYP